MHGRKEYMTKGLYDKYDERITRRKSYTTEGWKDCVTKGLHDYMTEGLFDGSVGKEGTIEGRKDGRKEGRKEDLHDDEEGNKGGRLHEERE
jgi:hypothetical protein